MASRGLSVLAGTYRKDGDRKGRYDLFEGRHSAENPDDAKGSDLEETREQQESSKSWGGGVGGGLAEPATIQKSKLQRLQPF